MRTLKKILELEHVRSALRPYPGGASGGPFGPLLRVDRKGTALTPSFLFNAFLRCRSTTTQALTSSCSAVADRGLASTRRLSCDPFRFVRHGAQRTCMSRLEPLSSNLRRIRQSRHSRSRSARRLARSAALRARMRSTSMSLTHGLQNQATRPEPVSRVLDRSVASSDV